MEEFPDWVDLIALGVLFVQGAISLGLAQKLRQLGDIGGNHSHFGPWRREVAWRAPLNEVGHSRVVASGVT